MPCRAAVPASHRNYSSHKTIGEEVVEVATATIHGDFDLGIGRRGDPGRPGELGTLISIHDLRLAIFGNRLVQSLNTEAGVLRAAPCA